MNLCIILEQGPLQSSLNSSNFSLRAAKASTLALILMELCLKGVVSGSSRPLRVVRWWGGYWAGRGCRTRRRHPWASLKPNLQMTAHSLQGLSTGRWGCLFAPLTEPKRCWRRLEGVGSTAGDYLATAQRSLSPLPPFTQEVSAGKGAESHRMSLVANYTLASSGGVGVGRPLSASRGPNSDLIRGGRQLL